MLIQFANVSINFQINSTHLNDETKPFRQLALDAVCGCDDGRSLGLQARTATASTKSWQFLLKF
jgi:hypothetical protein